MISIFGLFRMSTGSSGLYIRRSSCSPTCNSLLLTSASLFSTLQSICNTIQPICDNMMAPPSSRIIPRVFSLFDGSRDSNARYHTTYFSPLDSDTNISIPANVSICKYMVLVNPIYREGSLAFIAMSAPSVCNHNDYNELRLHKGFATSRLLGFSASRLLDFATSRTSRWSRDQPGSD